MHIKVRITGMGYTGQTLAATLAEVGYTVYGTDVNQDVLDYLNRGESHVLEKNLSVYIKKHINKRFFVGRPESIRNNDIDAHIVSVSTPIDENKKPDLKAIVSAFKEAKTTLTKGQLVVLRSTVPVGTTRDYVKPILEETGLKAGEDFHLVYAPERTIQGNALNELRSLPQIIGGINDKSIDVAANLFRKITPTIMAVSSLEAAELIKLLDNSYRDVRFAYAQELAFFCKKIGLNAFEIIRAANQGYPRNDIPTPSPGIGGVCLNKDPHILFDCSIKSGMPLKLVEYGRQINEDIPRRVAQEVCDLIDLKDKKIFIAGFAFKGYPETNDLRNSPTVELLKYLPKGNTIFGYDVVVEDWKIKNLGVTHTSNIYDGLKDADVAIFMNNHPSFASWGAEEFSKMKKGGLVYDGWNLFNKRDIEDLGLKYTGVGIG
ncbi:MAG: nucleotide sugar dehydrogenase [Nanoarchaeota archaeon]